MCLCKGKRTEVFHHARGHEVRLDRLQVLCKAPVRLHLQPHAGIDVCVVCESLRLCVSVFASLCLFVFVSLCGLRLAPHLVVDDGKDDAQHIVHSLHIANLQHPTRNTAAAAAAAAKQGNQERESHCTIIAGV